MPLHGKIVVLKRSGGDGTEFPLTSSCLFGRQPDCDIRIQLPHVSKEHCRIDLNENKEVILTNLSVANPTRVNGEILHQSDRLKHGDVITIVDRSFRFEYPPAPTPKKRRSTGSKTETLKVRQDQQAADTVNAGAADKRTSEVSTALQFKDGANHDNIQRSLEQTLEMESVEEKPMQSKSSSPFSDLYNMIKKSLDIKTPRKSVSVSQVQTPASKFCTPNPSSIRKDGAKTAAKVDQPEGSGIPLSAKKPEKSLRVSPVHTQGAEEGNTRPEVAPQKKRRSGTPQKFTPVEVIEEVSAPSPKPPTRRKSKGATPAKPEETQEQQELNKKSPKKESPRKACPRKSETANTTPVKEVTKKRKSAELGKDLPTQMKRKRVSFGGQLSPELFDKRLPPDSPLRRGAAPRRSLGVVRPKATLLRRASVIGFLKEQSPAKARSPSPKKLFGETSAAFTGTSPVKKSPKAATSAQKSPKSRPTSPKTPAAQKSPKHTSPKTSSAKKTQKSASPKTSPAQKSPRSMSTTPKAVSAQKSPRSRSTSPKSSTTPQKSSLTPSTPASVSKSSSTPSKTSSSSAQTPTVQGRFSVSLISTPSPTADGEAENDPQLAVTPKIPLKRKSMKKSARKTPSALRSASKMLQRRSGTSRASMKVFSSWAGVVKFGKSKPQVVASTRGKLPQKIKKTEQKGKLQTPAKVLPSHVSTGHANSPATIVVGRAHKRVAAVGAAPKVVMNAVISKKNLRMDEDLTGISEMFQTPVAERKRKSAVNVMDVTETPAGPAAATVMESVLSTPEESGEMIVSPLSVASTLKSRRYNSEAVQRLLNQDQADHVLALDAPPESVERSSGMKTATEVTPRRKAEQPQCLTGVKRIMKTPRQKTEPLEDLRGKILKTPRQKKQQQECLTGVKRIMKTPKQRAEPVEDIRGKLLTTPRNKPEQQECLTGVKRVFRTPKQKSEPIEDLRGKLLKTPRVKMEVRVSLGGVQELLGTPEAEQRDEEMQSLPTPPPAVRRTVKAPREKNSPVQDMVGVKRIFRSPKDKGEPVEDHFGLKRLMKSPRPKGNPPVEEFDGLQELMEEQSDNKRELDTDMDEVSMECAVLQSPGPRGDCDNRSATPRRGSMESAEAEKSLPQVDANAPQQHPGAAATNEEQAADKLMTADECVDNSERKKPRGRRARAVDPEKAEYEREEPESSEEAAATLPVRGRRGRRPATTAPPTGRQTRGRTTEALAEKSEPQLLEAVSRPKRGRKVQTTPAVQPGGVHEVTGEAATGPEEEMEPLGDSSSLLQAADVKPKRSRKLKQIQQPEGDDKALPCEKMEAAKDLEFADETHYHELADLKETLNVPDAEAEEVTQAVAEKKPTQGRKVRTLDRLQDEHKAESEADPAAAASPAVFRGRRGKKTEIAAAAPSTVRQRATRKAKAKEDASEQAVTEAPAEEEVTTTAEEKPGKPTRGRKAKAPAEPLPVTEEKDEHQDRPLKASPAAKPKRGRKCNTDTAEQKQEVRDSGESKEEILPPVRSRRGRKAKQEEQEEMGKTDQDVPLETAQPQELEEKESRIGSSEQTVPDVDETPVIQPVTPKPRRGGRKTKADSEGVMPEAATESPEEQDVPSEKPSRGRRGKPAVSKQEEQDSETMPPASAKRGRRRAAESAEVLEEPLKKPTRGRRGKQVDMEAVAAAEGDEDRVAGDQDPEKSVQDSLTSAVEESEETEAVQSVPAKRGRQRAAEPSEVLEVPSEKPTRARRGKRAAAEVSTAEREEEKGMIEAEEVGLAGTVEDTETAQPAPAKRGRRRAAESAEDPPAPAESKPVRRGRRAEAKPTGDQADPPTAQDLKPTKSVSWKADVDVFDIPKATPVRARRAARAKVQPQTENKSTSGEAEAAEEEPLSEGDAGAPPAKRGRRAAAAPAKTEEGPKPRRGRLLKK